MDCPNSVTAREENSKTAQETPVPLRAAVTGHQCLARDLQWEGEAAASLVERRLSQGLQLMPQLPQSVSGCPGVPPHPPSLCCCSFTLMPHWWGLHCLVLPADLLKGAAFLMNDLGM